MVLNQSNDFLDQVSIRARSATLMDINTLRLGAISATGPLTINADYIFLSNPDDVIELQHPDTILPAWWMSVLRRRLWWIEITLLWCLFKRADITDYQGGG